MFKEVKYIGFYDIDELGQNRMSALSAINKMNYIINALNNVGKAVIVISPSWTNGSKSVKKTNIQKGKNRYVFPMSFKWQGIFKILNIMYSNIWLLFYLLRNCKRNETVIVYHSMYLINILSLVKKIKKIRIILEVEEIYSDVSFKNKKKEYKMFALADKYIFITEMLNKKINIYNKPYCISHGTYKKENKLTDKYDDEKVHIVYSGIIDKQKKGAFTALQICKYLEEKYKLHIIGFGSQDNINELIDNIEKNNKTNNCKAVFDGKLTGEEYKKYLQRCDIGLSTQDPAGEYNATSFPSKILAYLSNGLRVVSVNIPAIKTSDVGNILYYYDADSPKEIASVIKNIDIADGYESRTLIDNLNSKFEKELNEMLEEKNGNDK